MQNLFDRIKILHDKAHKSKSFKYAMLGLIGLKLLKVTRQKYLQSRRQKQLASLGQQKRKSISDAIEKFKQAHGQEFNFDNELKNLLQISSIKEIQNLLYQGKVTVLQVLLTFIERSIEFGVPNNWISDVLFEEAYQLAKAQDEQLSQNKEIVRQKGNELFGIPVSIKDMILVKGTDCTLGLATNCFLPQEDGFLSLAVKRAGGIIFVKTTNPQFAMTIETNSFVYGRAKNPHDNQRTTGGSSGGEGAFAAKRCSVIGIGTDIGGSIRVPSAFCGAYGYKPANARSHIYGVMKVHPTWTGYKNLIAVSGPMGYKVDDLAVMMQILQDEEFYAELPSSLKDIYYRPTAFDWKEYGSGRKLRIGYIKSVDFVPASNACQRAVTEAIERLGRLGHEIVEFKMESYYYSKAMELSYKFVTLDSELRAFTEISQGEPFIPEYSEMSMISRLPKGLVQFVKNVLLMKGWQRDALMLEALSQKWSGYQALEFSGQMMSLREEMSELWEHQGIDVLIAPVTAGVALKHGQVNQALLTILYTFVWNFYDYNAGVVPLGRVRQDEQHYTFQDTAKDFFYKTMNQCMSNSEGMPIGVQVITKPFKDELCLRVMKQLQDSLQSQ